MATAHHHPLWIILCLFLFGTVGSFAAAPDYDPSADLKSARQLFEANLGAIQERDRAAYLDCYLQSENLMRVGPGGPNLGYAGLEASAGSGWPDFFNAQDLQLVSLRPGLVFGTYRYRVRYGDQEVRGLSERVFLQTAEGWKIAVTTAFPDPPGTPPPAMALVGGTLIDGTGSAPIPNAVVIIEGGRITCAGPAESCSVDDSIQQVDTSGSWITPGLVDTHVHFSQTGWADGRPDSLDLRAEHPYEEVQQRLKNQPEPFWRAHLCSGVTAVFDVGGYSWTWDLRERASRSGRAPHVAVSGPLLSTRDFWVNLEGEKQFIHLSDPEAAVRGVKYLASRQTDAIKIWFIPKRGEEEALDAAVLAAGSAAREHEVPLIVHATRLREAKVALQAGAHLLVHSVWDQPLDDGFLQLAKEAGTFYNPTLTVGRGYLRMYESANSNEPPTIDDPNGCVDQATLANVASTAGLAQRDDQFRMPQERYERSKRQIEKEEKISAENLLRAHQAGIPIVMGTDAGNPLTLHGPSVYTEMEAMQAAGMDAMDVLVAATRNGARVIGKGEEIGTVEAGKIADLLIVGADPSQDIRHLRQLRFVMRGGELRPLAELQALRD